VNACGLRLSWGSAVYPIPNGMENGVVSTVLSNGPSSRAASSESSPLDLKRVSSVGRASSVALPWVQDDDPGLPLVPKPHFQIETEPSLRIRGR